MQSLLVRLQTVSFTWPLVACHYVMYFIITEEEIPNMRDLRRYIIMTHAPHWRDIGVELKLKTTRLNNISIYHPNDCTACFAKTLGYWLSSNPNATWGVLEVAITNVMRAKLGLERVNDLYGECVTISGMYLSLNMQFYYIFCVYVCFCVCVCVCVCACACACACIYQTNYTHIRRSFSFMILLY